MLQSLNPTSHNPSIASHSDLLSSSLPYNSGDIAAFEFDPLREHWSMNRDQGGVVESLSSSTALEATCGTLRSSRDPVFMSKHHVSRELSTLQPVIAKSKANIFSGPSTPTVAHNHSALPYALLPPCENKTSGCSSSESSGATLLSPNNEHLNLTTRSANPNHTPSSSRGISKAVKMDIPPTQEGSDDSLTIYTYNPCTERSKQETTSDDHSRCVSEMCAVRTRNSELAISVPSTLSPCRSRSIKSPVSSTERRSTSECPTTSEIPANPIAKKTGQGRRSQQTKVESREEEVKYSNTGRPQRNASIIATQRLVVLQSYLPDDTPPGEKRKTTNGPGRPPNSAKRVRLSDPKSASTISLKTRNSGKLVDEDMEYVPETTADDKTLPNPTTKPKKRISIQTGKIIQDRQCIPYRTLGAKQCWHCISRYGGETCRFVGIRQLEFSNGQVVNSTLISDLKPATVQFPDRWNVDPGPDQLLRIQQTVAKNLLPVLITELKHIRGEAVILRPQEINVRATCDFCATSLFSGCYICAGCGREACSDCYELVGEFELLTLPDARSRKYCHCTYNDVHGTSDFRATSRFQLNQLETTIREMGNTLKVIHNTLDSEATECPPSEAFRLLTVQDPSGVPSLPIHASGPELSELDFLRVWSKGEPVVITGLSSKFKLAWDPDYFIKNHGEQECFIYDCQSSKVHTSNVAAFFNKFGHPTDSRGILKLKDWPYSADFKSKFPDLFDDFSQAVPIPNYTRRDGVLNIASHFPINTVAPDIGPKMYNAYKSSEEPGDFGSTRLHMDMADAVNVLLYASCDQTQSPGCAAWNIFRAEDAALVREFLRDHRRSQDDTVTTQQNVSDPIHSQEFFLDTALRKQLFESKGVQSWRIEQKPGDAIFIPAGCAHQVTNLADCIKVAVDFVSPENVERCSKLTKEFREQNEHETWKEDILQLHTMMCPIYTLNEFMKFLGYNRVSDG